MLFTENNFPDKTNKLLNNIINTRNNTMRMRIKRQSETQAFTWKNDQHNVSPFHNFNNAGSDGAAARIAAQLRGEQQRPLLGVAPPVVLVAFVGQVPAAHPLLKRPQVAPQLEVLVHRGHIIRWI